MYFKAVFLFFTYIVLVLDIGLSYCLQPKKHVVMLIVDDWGWGDFGLHGSNEVQTPNLDAFFYSGIILQNYYTMPLCTPSRAALMTGMHPAHIGMQHHVLNPGEPWGLPRKLKILPQYLKQEGYQTYAIGKWHLGDFKVAYTPTKRGFDYHYGYWEGRQSYRTHELLDTGSETVHRNVSGYDMRCNLNVSWSSCGKYATDLFTDEAVNVINTHNTSHPMFLYVAHLAMHAGNMNKPFEAPPDIVKKFNYIRNPMRRTFAAMLWKLDDSIGKIIAALGRQNLLSNTVIVLTTDNGGAAHGYDGSIASNWPLRGGKGSLWEGGVRGNGAVWSADLPSSRMSNHFMRLEDWLPTILGAINSTQLYEDDLKLDGRNMWPTLKGIQDGHTYDDMILNADPIDGSFAYRQGDYKIIHGNWLLNRWYLPGNKSHYPPYNVAAIENSFVARTFKALHLSFPSKELMSEMRESVLVMCPLPIADDGTNKTVSDCEPCHAKSEVCLFNVKTDPCEMNNLAKQMPDLLESMISQVNNFKIATPLNEPYDARSNPKYWNYTYTHWCDYVKCEYTAKEFKTKLVTDSGRVNLMVSSNLK